MAENDSLRNLSFLNLYIFFPIALFRAYFPFNFLPFPRCRYVSRGPAIHVFLALMYALQSTAFNRRSSLTRALDLVCDSKENESKR